MPTPAEELRAAAQVLRETAAAASPGPWAVNDWGNVQTAQHEEMADVWPLQSKPGANAAHIALMGPDVGHALADWLDSEAARLTAAVHPDRHETYGAAALAVARALNGDR